MAGSDQDITIKKEIEAVNFYLKESKAEIQKVKVIESLGELSYIIKFPQFNEFGVNLTIQVGSDKNIKNAEIIVNTPNAEKNADFSEKLKTLLTSGDNAANGVLTNFYIEATALFSEYKNDSKAKKLNEKDTKKKSNNKENEKKSKITSTDDVDDDAVNKSDEKHKKKSSDKETDNQSKITTIDDDTVAKKDDKSKNKNKKQQKQQTQDNADTSTKKVSMKTAADVVHRIQWDEEIDKEHIIVGYLDRFLGIKECEFNTFDWGDIVLADLGALAIPEHRINYFKYKGEVIWDKNQRLDNVFGSTGSNTTIYDVIEKNKDSKIESKNDKEDEVVDGACAKPLKKEKAASPNYFISIPIENKEIIKNFADLKDELMTKNPDLSEIILPETSLHITICTLRMDTKEEMDKVTKILNKLRPQLAENLPINLAFDGISDFFDKTLYIKCKCVLQRLANLRTQILKAFENDNVNTVGNSYDFVPHLTIFKLKNSSKKIRDYLDNTVLKQFENTKLGEQAVNELHLCKMTNILAMGTYPVEYTLKLNKE